VRRSQPGGPFSASNVFRLFQPGVGELDEHCDIDRMAGEVYFELFTKVRRVFSRQFDRGIRRGIRGFIFHGDVGVGKTRLAKAVARDMRLPLLYVDGHDIARARYGESEAQIYSIFNDCDPKPPRWLVLIDDAESVFPRRDWERGQSWHVAQNNILLHVLDALDTSRTGVIMTTNRFDLMDPAVVDRLYPLEFPQPGPEALQEAARGLARVLQIPEQAVIERLQSESTLPKSFRAVERLVYQFYVEGET